MKKKVWDSLFVKSFKLTFECEKELQDVVKLVKELHLDRKFDGIP